MAKLTLIGLNNYDPNLFNGLTVPEGIDKETLVNSILMRGGEYEVLYPDIDFMKSAISFWSSKWRGTMERWLKAITTEYNPLENYDRIEEWSDSSSGASTASDSSTTSNEGKVSAYDSDAYQPHDMSTASQSSTTSGNSQGLTEHTGRTHGNIGVTTSQQMLQAEYDIALWNLYDHIADVFLKEFIIPIA